MIQNVDLSSLYRRYLKMYDLGDIVEMKKPHACQANRWEIIRMGADIKIKCTNCGHIVMMSRRDFEKKMKKILEKKD
jgi:hypothetical protein